MCQGGPENSQRGKVESDVSHIAYQSKALQLGDGHPSYQKTEDSGDQVQRNEKIEKVEFGMQHIHKRRKFLVEVFILCPTRTEKSPWLSIAAPKGNNLPSILLTVGLRRCRHTVA